MRHENKTEYTIKGKVGCRGDTMSFGEIAEVMGLTEAQVKRIYEGAIRKLKRPGNNRALWEYLNIGDSMEDEPALGDGTL